MFDSSQILGFVAAVLVLILVPGPNTMLILAHSLAEGRTVGLAAAVGVELGTLVHVLAAAFGLSAVLSSSAAAFAAVKYAGVAYLVFLGLRLLGDAGGSVADSSPNGLELTRVLRRAVLTNVLNPKVAIFFLAFLPQFVRPERGNVILQFIVLGLIVIAIGFCFGCILAVAAGQASVWLRNETFARWQGRLTGGMFLGLGIYLALAQHAR